MVEVWSRGVSAWGIRWKGLDFLWRLLSPCISLAAAAAAGALSHEVYGTKTKRHRAIESVAKTEKPPFKGSLEAEHLPSTFKALTIKKCLFC